ncbi:MAG: YwaF family protein [Bacilli bacterium]|nr:YwaF family protein [Bacilli bacterium]
MKEEGKNNQKLMGLLPLGGCLVLAAFSSIWAHGQAFIYAITFVLSLFLSYMFLTSWAPKLAEKHTKQYPSESDEAKLAKSKKAVTILTTFYLVVAIAAVLMGNFINWTVCIVILIVCFAPLAVRLLFKLVDKKSNPANPIYIWFHRTFNISTKEQFVLTCGKVVGLLAVILFFVRFYFAESDYLEGVRNLQSDFMSPFEVGISAIVGYLANGCLILVAISSFFPTPVFRGISKFVVTPTLILEIFFFPLVVQGVVGQVSTSSFSWRALLMGLELGVNFAVCLRFWKENPSFKTSEEERYGIILAAVLLVCLNITSYTLSNFFGEKSIYVVVPIDLNSTHRVLLGVCVALPILYFLVLFRFDKLHRRAFLCFIAYSVLVSYISTLRYDIWSSITSYPLHICNTAMYTMPLTLVFVWTPLFYFTMFINVIGAAFALLMPDYSTSHGIFSPAIVEFYINHYYAFFLPVLIVILGIYGRPKIKYFFYSMGGFLIYYLTVGFVNNFVQPRLPYGQTIDFFFINSTFIADKLGNFGEAMYKPVIEFSDGTYTYKIHALYLLVYYVFYCAFALAMWFVYELLFKIVDETDALLTAKEKIRAKMAIYAKMSKEGIAMENTNVPEIKIVGLTKRYGNATKNAVTNFNMDIVGGKIYGFLGKNGAGKSTIIKSIVGIHGINEGSILVCGHDIAKDPSGAKSCIGYVPDNYALYENLTGRQYISYIADLYKVSKEDREARVPALVDQLEMNERFDMPMRTYSHGMKQKITIIAALVHEPAVWILDEPMTGLDPNSIFQIKELMRQHAAKGNIVFFSSHIIDIVKNLCDEVFIVKKGDVLAHEQVKTLKSKHIDLEKLFLELTADSDAEAKALMKEVEA